MNLEISLDDAGSSAPEPDDPGGLAAPCAIAGSPGGIWASLAVVGLALGFVVVGRRAAWTSGPQEARLGLAAGERIGPMGQVLGYWAPDLWPAQVLPSLALTRLTPSGRPTTARGPLAGRAGGDPRRVDPGPGDVPDLRHPRRDLLRILLVQQPGRDRSLGRRGPRPDPRAGHAGGHRPLADAAVRTGSPGSGPPWRSWRADGRPWS